MGTSTGAATESAVAPGQTRQQLDKFAVRRAELAAAALSTLSEFGYAHTSLREIAQKSGFSHGVFHYYFRDKLELITYCVREYKGACITHYAEITDGSSSAEQVRAAFAAALATSARDDTAMHRLWYDLRNQGLFDDAFQADVTEVDASLEEMVWRVVTTYAAFLGAEVALPRPTVYAMVDGLFHRAILALHAGTPDAVASLQEGVWQLLPRLVAGFGSSDMH